MKSFISIILFSLMGITASAQCSVNFTNEVDCEVVVEFATDNGGGVFTSVTPQGIFGYTFPCYIGVCPQVNANGTCYMEVGAPWAPNSMTVDFNASVCSSGNPIAVRLVSLNGDPTPSAWVSINNPAEVIYPNPVSGCCPIAHLQASGTGFLITMGCGM